MWWTGPELAAWVRCKLKAIALAAVILVVMGLIGVIAALAGG